eukprot:jgi/Chlat1/4906/Chrsp31S00376
MRSIALHAPAAFFGGWESVAAPLSSHFVSPLDIEFSTEVDNVETGACLFQQELRAVCDLLPRKARPLIPPFTAMARTVTYMLQKSLSSKVDDAVVMAYEHGATLDDKARRMSASGVDAGAWLSALPFLSALRISADLF